MPEWVVDNWEALGVIAESDPELLDDVWEYVSHEIIENPRKPASDPSREFIPDPLPEPGREAYMVQPDHCGGWWIVYRLEVESPHYPDPEVIVLETPFKAFVEVDPPPDDDDS